MFQFQHGMKSRLLYGFPFYYELMYCTESMLRNRAWMYTRFDKGALVVIVTINTSRQLLAMHGRGLAKARVQKSERIDGRGRGTHSISFTHSSEQKSVEQPTA